MRNAVFALLGAYLLGSFSGAILAARLFHDIDIRKYGSGNAGLTNTLRTLGLPTACAVLFLDVAKTVLAVLLGRYLAGETGFLCAAAGVALGHAFPVYHRFKGGKVVLCSSVICAFFEWRAFLVLLAVFIWVIYLTGKASVGSLTVAVLMPFSLWAFRVSWNRIYIAALLVLMVVLLHHENIRRLKKDQEPPATL